MNKIKYIIVIILGVIFYCLTSSILILADINNTEYSILAKKYYELTPAKFSSYNWKFNYKSEGGYLYLSEDNKLNFKDGVIGGTIDDFDNDGHYELLVFVAKDNVKKISNGFENITNSIESQIYEVINGKAEVRKGSIATYDVLRYSDGVTECFIKKVNNQRYIVMQTNTGKALADGEWVSVKIIKYDGSSLKEVFGLKKAGSTLSAEENVVNNFKKYGFINTYNKFFDLGYDFRDDKKNYGFTPFNIANIEDNVYKVIEILTNNNAEKYDDWNIDNNINIKNIVDKAIISATINNKTNIICPISVIINGKQISFDVSPYIESGVTMVPMRAIFEELGAKVSYDDKTKTITAQKGNTIIELVLGSNNAKINGAVKILDVATVNKNGSTMIPVRFIAEALGAEVYWDNNKNTVNIDYYELSNEEKLNSAKQMFANFFKGNQEFLFEDEQLLYKLMYKEFYVDNVSGHIIDKFAKYITDNEVDEDKYMEILSTMLTLSDMEFSSAIYNQMEYDSNKTVKDYVFDIFDIISSSVSPEASSKSYIAQQVLNGGKEVASIVSNASDKAKIIDNIGQSTQRKIQILDAIYNNTEDKQLKSAIIKIKESLSNTTLAELDIIAKSSDDLSKYVGDEILFKEMMFPLLKETDIYKSDETVKFFVDGSSEIFNNVTDGLGSFTTGAKLGLFAGDMILGTTDTVNDVTSIKAIYEISQSMEAYLLKETKKINSLNIDELKMLVSKYNFLTYIHLRGEYIAYNLVAKDQKLFSLLLKDEKETLDKYMNIHIQWLKQINKILNNDIFI